MKRRIALLTTAVLLAGAPVASAAITESSNRGHPNTNPSGKCPGGHNQDATPGAQNKCG